MKLISSVEKYKNPLFSVTEDHAVEPGGFEIKRSIVQHPGSAVMMAVDDRKRILLVRQYRLPARDYLWELPAGKVDPGETPLQAAKRELIEETGYRAKKWAKLATFYASPGYVAEKMTIFLATGLTEGKATPMEDERIRTRWFTDKEVRDGIRSGKIIDGKTMIGYFNWKALPRK
ncbi:MAG TPA: NUDIX hydrolase [Bryobacteraceae bacterium]|nr:NUDIX hydrolase [Bryobacteraceae bacterium]